MGPLHYDTRPLSRLRWAARVPRMMALALAGLLAVAGLRAALTGPPRPPAPSVRVASPDLSAEGVAEQFARAYLTWDASRPERHERQLAGFLSSSLEPGAGLSLPGRGSERPLWSAVLADRRLGPGRRLVTVAVQTTRRQPYLAVPLARTAAGLVFVSGYPAFVGGPATAPAAEAPEEQELDDPDLRAVVRRALSNYLARQVQDLRADLDRDAVVSLPPAPLRMASLDGLTRAGRGRAAAQLTARDRDGASLSLRYELGVVKRDRWYLRSIGWNPIARRSP